VITLLTVDGVSYHEDAEAAALDTLARFKRGEFVASTRLDDQDHRDLTEVLTKILKSNPATVDLVARAYERREESSGRHL
jgi:hypothetical protein